MGDRREPEPEHESDPASRSAADVSDALGLRSAGNLGPSEPHVVVTTEAPELTGASYTFTTLPDGSLIVDYSCNEDLSRLAALHGVTTSYSPSPDRTVAASATARTASRRHRRAA